MPTFNTVQTTNLTPPARTQVAGQKAVFPQTKANPPVLPAAQAQKVAPVANSNGIGTGSTPMNNGLIGNQTSLAGSNQSHSVPYDPKNPYPYYVNQVGNFRTSNDPIVNKYQNELDQLNQQYSANMGVAATLSNPNGYLSNLMGIQGAQYNSRAATLASLLGSAQTGAGQTLGAQEYAAGATAPQNQLGFLTAPTTGNPIYGNGSISGLAPLAYKAGQINNAGNLAAQGQNQGIGINNARDSVTQLSNLLKTSNLNQSQYAAKNWLGNVVAQNLSDPTLGPIQNAITSAINQYALAQGIPAANLTNSLLSQSGSQSILSVLNNLDTGAYNNYTNTGNIATGGGVAAPATNLGTATNSTSGVTTGGNKYVITPYNNW